LAANKRAIAECSDVEKLREVAVNLMEGWSNMQEAVGSLVKENLELRQAMSVKEWDLQAAAELLDEATQMVNDEVQRQSSQAKRRLWPFG
jgi:predicted  nucleic acid-binding Zn-ribbon protein